MLARRVALAGAALAFVGLTIVGCSAVVSPKPPSPRATATSIPASTPPEHVLDGVIATGTLASLDSRTTGEVVLTATGNTVIAALQGFQTPAAGQIDLQLSPFPLNTKCAADRLSFVMNQASAADTWTLPMTIPGGPFDEDPTYLRTVIVRADSAAGKPNSDGCVYPPLAAAELNWKLAPTHIDLAVSDHGVRDHATGTVTMANGRPSTYTVAPEDTLEAIEGRFGITADGFRYLNPYNEAITTPTLKYGTVYNLSPSNRGAPPD
jgi:hypothetical protein